MIVTLDEFKSGVERYLRQVGEEGIIITEDGQNIAQITPPPKSKREMIESLIGTLPSTVTVEEARAERLAKYEAGL